MIVLKFFFVKDENEKNKVSNNMILRYIEKMKREAVSHSILILRARLNRQAEKSICLIEEETEGHVRIETFQESELLVNITDHILVPKHQLLTKEEKKHLLTRYKVKEAHLPRIRIDDPVAKYMGLVRGDVIRIIRSSETSGRYVTYRICVKEDYHSM